MKVFHFFSILYLHNEFNSLLLKQRIGGDIKVFSEILRELRKTNKMTQVELSKKLSLDKSSIAKYESANVIPSPEVLVKIANIFNVTVDYLLGNTTNQPTSKRDDEVTQLLQELKDRPEMKTLFSISKNATKEEILQAVKIIEALRDPKDDF